MTVLGRPEDGRRALAFMFGSKDMLTGFEKVCPIERRGMAGHDPGFGFNLIDLSGG